MIIAASLLAAVPGHAATPAKSATKSAIANSSDSNKSGGISQEMLNRNHYYLALGPVVTSDYEGSDDYELQPLMIARWDRRGAFVEFRGDTLRANVIPMSLFQAGPMVRYHRARKSVADSQVDRMRDISSAIEAGGFVGVMLRDPSKPRRRLGLRVATLKDVSGSYDGSQTTLTLEGGWPFSDRWSIDAEVASHYASSKYMNTYFSVDANNAGLSGLPQFHAGAGFEDVGLNLMLSHQISGHWGVGLIGTYKRMLGDAGSSPVVADAGSRNQLVGGLVATWTY